MVVADCPAVPFGQSLWAVQGWASPLSGPCELGGLHSGRLALRGPLPSGLETVFSRMAFTRGPEKWKGRYTQGSDLQARAQSPPGQDAPLTTRGRFLAFSPERGFRREPVGIPTLA